MPPIFVEISNNSEIYKKNIHLIQTAFSGGRINKQQHDTLLTNNRK
jgi:hypothetical protein